MKKIIWFTITLFAAAALYITLYQPDQLVEPSFNQVSKQVKSVQADTTLEKPVIATVQPIQPLQTVSTPAPVQHKQVPNQTPDPVIADAIPPSPTNYQRTDGFENYCMQMPDGSWTTVIFQGTASGTMYPYNGPIDPATQSPATATGSQQWCLDNSNTTGH